MAINLRLNIQFLGSNRLVELASGLSSSQRSSQAWQPENGISCDSGQIQLISSLGKVSFLGDVSGSIEGTFLPQITKIIAGNVLLNDNFPAKFPAGKRLQARGRGLETSRAVQLRLARPSRGLRAQSSAWGHHLRTWLLAK